MLKFLVTVLLAIVIFAPACAFSSKFLRLSGQAESNFADFFEKIDQLGKYGQEGEERTFVLIMDEGTCIADLWPNNLDSYVRCPLESDVEENWKDVGKSCNNEDCICLIQDFITTETDVKISNCGQERKLNEIMPTKIGCIQVPESYYIYGLDWERTWCRFEDDSRRMTMGMVKQGNKVFVCKDPPCQLPDNPVKHIYKG